MKKIYLSIAVLMCCFSVKAQSFSEGFEGAVFPPAGWLVTDNNIPTSAIDWDVMPGIPFPAHTGTNCAFANRENIGLGNTSEEWLVTPAINITENNMLSFFSRQTLVGDTGTIYEIRLSTTSQTDQSSFVPIASWSETTISPADLTYELKMVSLEDFSGTAYIAFIKKHTQPGAATSGDRWLLDDVSIGPVNGVTGEVKYTTGTDCSSNTNPIKHARITVADTEGTYSVFTDNQGRYAYHSYLLGGNLTASVTNASLYNISPISHNYVFTEFGNTETVDFCLSPNTLQPNLQAYIVASNVVAGSTGTKTIIYQNTGSQPVSGTLTMTFPSNHFHAVDNINYSVSGNTISWNYSNLMPFETRQVYAYFNINTPTDPQFPVNFGDSFLLSVLISPVAGDYFPPDNSSAVYTTAVVSIDPNDIMVSEGPFITPDQTDDFLHYTIRFQNIGSAAAEKVLVRNLLEDNLDPDTFEIIGGSHDFGTTLNGRALEFTFNNINLPSMAENEEASKGYLAYRIKPTASVGMGSVIKNQAEIFFDFNYPIQTNTAMTTVTNLGTQNFNNGAIFNVYPNPVNEELNIDAPNTEILLISIANNLGQKVLTPNKSVKKIDVSQLKTGIYFITLVTAKGQTSQKFLKQ
ncbi:choice-of-anchor J domain-containing protein [Flavobacterium sp.]|uniref:DUF7619 domain-containing protein n=1 Tax=Flavobacterium sp. TaxID=239 RepID=UPI0039E68EA2